MITRKFVQNLWINNNGWHGWLGPILYQRFQFFYQRFQFLYQGFQKTLIEICSLFRARYHLSIRDLKFSIREFENSLKFSIQFYGVALRRPPSIPPEIVQVESPREVDTKTKSTSYKWDYYTSLEKVSPKIGGKVAFWD